ncbi:MAG: ISAs1 family transposase [Treponema sp.]|jgi:hypothetical protein|nr:ISAs1 family transposase [Treponema sp.]
MCTGRERARLKPEELEARFMRRIQDLRLPIDREVVAIDGKTIRGSADKFACLKAAHVVSAWAADNRLVLGQVKTEEKSKGNEVSTITAIPQLLAMFALKGSIITIDAAD